MARLSGGSKTGKSGCCRKCNTFNLKVVLKVYRQYVY
nr:MAG TPA: Non-structural protein NS3/Small envelope protein E [Caudoviricetes sp.]DAW30220.1 MAG TPA: Non-structural protein NS3/Small envelope protein E [Caudoviricetes sp.]